MVVGSMCIRWVMLLAWFGMVTQTQPNTIDHGSEATICEGPAHACRPTPGARATHTLVSAISRHSTYLSVRVHDAIAHARARIAAQAEKVCTALRMATRTPINCGFKLGR